MANKVTVIGAGSVGSTIAFMMAVKGIAAEIVLIDVNEKKALGEAMDIHQGSPLLAKPVTVSAGTYEAAAGSEIVVITSGLPRKPGQTRIDLAQTNVDIMKDIASKITKTCPDATYIIVSNPVDILTYVFHKVSGIPEDRIIGSGTLLDTEALDETGYLEDDPAVISAPVTLTQEDVRAVQLVKSAIHAGMRTLIHTAQLSCDGVNTLYIAGGFGSYLDVQNAGKIGLLPEELTHRVTVLGNAALTGASMLLLRDDLRPVCEKLARETKVVELATSPVFVSEYMERMMF